MRLREAGIRAYPLCSPEQHDAVLHHAEHARSSAASPTWHPILLSSDEEKLRAYTDPAVRRKLHDEVVEWSADMPGGGLRPELVRLHVGRNAGTGEE